MSACIATKLGIPRLAPPGARLWTTRLGPLVLSAHHLEILTVGASIAAVAAGTGRRTIVELYNPPEVPLQCNKKAGV